MWFFFIYFFGKAKLIFYLWAYGGNKNEADTSAVEEASVFDYKGI